MQIDKRQVKSIWFSICGIALAWCGFVQAQTAGSIDSTFDVGGGPSSSISSVLALGDNKLLVGGYFSTWNGNESKGLVRLQTNGSLDQSFQVSSGPTFIALGLWEQTDKKILVSGVFSSINSQPRTNLARLHQNGLLDTNFTANCNGSVRDIALLPDGRLLIVGPFQTVNSVARPGMALLHSDGSVDSSFIPESGISGFGTSAQILPDGRFLTAGCTWNDGVRYVFNLLRMSPSGIVDKQFYLADISFFANRIFPLSNGNLLLQTAFQPARLLTNDSLDQHFTNGSGSIFSSILALQPDDRQLVAGNSLKDVFGMPSTFVRLFADGKIDPSFNASLQGAPSKAVVRPDGKIIIAGYISPKGQPSRDTLLALFSSDVAAPSEVLWQARGSDAIHNGSVTVKLIRQGNSNAAASLEWKATVSSNDLQVIPSSGSVSFEPGQTVEELTVLLSSAHDTTSSVQFDLLNLQGAVAGTNQSLTLYVTNQTGVAGFLGTESSVAEIQGNLSYQLTRTGAINRPGVVGWRIVGETNPEDDFVLVSGSALFSAKQNYANIYVRLKDNTDVQPSRIYRLEIFPVDPDWTTPIKTNLTLTILDNDLPGFPGLGVDDKVTDSMALADGGVLVFGVFSSFNGVARSGITRLNSSGALDPSFAAPPINGSITDHIELSDGRILFCGNFTTVNGQPFPGLVRLLPSGEVDATFVSPPTFPTTPTSLALTAQGSILVGADFAQFNGTSGSKYLGTIVRLNLDGEKDTNFSTFTSAEGPVKLCTLPNGQFFAYGSVKAATNAYRTTSQPATFRSGVIRFNANGTVDETFEARMAISVSGQSTPTAPTPRRLYPYSDGRVLIGGYFTNINSRATPGLARLSPTGELDLPFLTNVTKILGLAATVVDFAVAPEGSIVVLLTTTTRNQLLVRLNVDGALVSSLAFGLTGATIQAYENGRFFIGSTPGVMRILSQIRYGFAWLNSDGSLQEYPQVGFISLSSDFPHISLNIISLVAGSFQILSSSDLKTWFPGATVLLSVGQQTVPIEASQNASFYRFLKVP